MASELVVIQASQLQKLNFLNQGTTRLRVECFDLSPTLIVLGANSGTVYILNHESMELKHQVPTGVGSVVQLSISPDECYVAYAQSNGLVDVFEIPAQDGNGCRQIISSKEHEGHIVSSVIWSQNSSEIYIGDTTGRVSVLFVPKSKTAMLFRTSSIHLMTLDSGVTQLDYSENYLLVSTLTRSYICNTVLETFAQVGTKLRQGEYGGCFCRVYPNAAPIDSTKNSQDTNVEASQATENTLSGSGKFNLSDCYEAVEEEVQMVRVRYSQEKSISSPLVGSTSRIFCARPGTRLWEVDHSGKVLVTHQLKRALLVPPADVWFTDGSLGENEYQNRYYVALDRKAKQDLDYLEDHGKARDQDQELESSSSNPTSVSHPPVSVAFTKLLSFYNSYLLAISTYGLYIIDPSNSKVLLWISVAEGVTEVKVSGNTIIYKTGNGGIQNLMITTVDIAVLALHTKGLINECAQLCLQYEDIFRNSKLLCKVGVTILSDLATQVKDEVVRDKLENLKKILVHEKDQTDLTDTSSPPKSGYYLEDENYRTDDMKKGLTSMYRMGHHVFLPLSVTRWYSEPHLTREPNRNLSLSQTTISVEDSPCNQAKATRYPSSTTSTYFTEAHSSLSLTQFSSEDTLQSASSAKSFSGLSMSSQYSGTRSSTPDITCDGGQSSSSLHSGNWSTQSESKSSLRSSDTSQEMYEDPLFPPGEESHGLEIATRLLLDNKHKSFSAYEAHNIYSYGYAPIHPGSETAAILQDLMENVTTNVVDTIATGTKTLTEKLKSVGPLRPGGDWSPLTLRRETLAPQQTIGKSPTEWDDHHSQKTDEVDTFDTDIVIKTKTKKKTTRTGSGSSPAISRTSTMPDTDELLRSSVELPSVVRNLHELVTSTLWQIQQTKDQETAWKLLMHWFEVYCNTIQQIQSRRLSPQVSDEVQGEGPVSLSSMDSSYSIGSGGTCESLHWDSNDIGFEPSCMSADIIEQITELFLQCVHAGVHLTMIENVKLVSGIQIPDMLPHPLTPEEVKKIDSFCATLILNDCGLLRYSTILNGLESLSRHYYVYSWAALLEKVTKDFDTYITHPLPDIISDLDFTRSQRAAFLHKLALSGNMKNFVNAATRIDNPAVILDVVLILNYLSVRAPELNCNSSRSQYQKQYLLQYLTELSMTKNLRKMYLDSWCKYPELQHDILNAIFSALKPDSFSCTCGMPLPRKRPLPMKNFVEIILTHHIIDAREIANLCQASGYWDGYCSLSLEYNLQPTLNSLPYIIQNCNLDLLQDCLELIRPSSYDAMFATLAAATTEDSFVIRCFRCQKKINLVLESEASLQSSMSNFVYKFRVNGEPQFKNSTAEDDSAWTETLYQSLQSPDPSHESHQIQKNEVHLQHVEDDRQLEKCVLNISQLWEIMIAYVLRRKGPAETIKHLQTVEAKIPAGTIPQKVYNWCIMASLVEGKGPAVRWALVDSLTNAKRRPFSQKVSKLLHRDGNETNNRNSTQTPENAVQQHPKHSPPRDESFFKEGARPLGHHWGVRSQVLQGVCFCCHLKLPTEALVTEGGITVFPCGHSFHTICVLHRGHQCVICLQRTVHIASQYVQYGNKFL